MQGNSTIGQLGHQVGLHVTVNLEGKTVGGVLCDAEQWFPGVIVGTSALGNALTIKLDSPIGASSGHGLLGHKSRGQDVVSVDDPARVRPQELADVQPAGVPDDIVELARGGNTGEAIKRYRALNVWGGAVAGAANTGQNRPRAGCNRTFPNPGNPFRGHPTPLTRTVFYRPDGGEGEQVTPHERPGTRRTPGRRGGGYPDERVTCPCGSRRRWSRAR
jgi:hypothetical protein